MITTASTNHTWNGKQVNGWDRKWIWISVFSLCFLCDVFAFSLCVFRFACLFFVRFESLYLRFLCVFCVFSVRSQRFFWFSWCILRIFSAFAARFFWFSLFFRRIFCVFCFVCFTFLCVFCLCSVRFLCVLCLFSAHFLSFLCVLCVLSVCAKACSRRRSTPTIWTQNTSWNCFKLLLQVICYYYYYY